MCEGYTDVIGCDLAGFSEAVATCGTALTKQHAELLSRSAKRIVLAFDADAAGQAATERVHQWEREFGLDVLVAALPPGADPGDLAASDPPALRRALEDAQPLHAFRAERILQRAELDSPGGRDRAADEAAEVLAVYPAEVLLDDDLAPIAARIPMEVAQFRDRVDAARQRQLERQASAGIDQFENAPPPPDPGDGYFDSMDDEYSSSFASHEDLGADAGDRYDTTSVQRSAGQSRQRIAQRSAQADADLLAAAAAPHGDAFGLMVPELFATSIGREAFARMEASPEWRESATNPAGGASQIDGDALAETLRVAAADGAHLSAEEANDRVATAMLHYVRFLIDTVSAGGEIPRVRLDASLSDEAQMGFRHQCLRWLRQRQPELHDLQQRIGAVSSVRDWLDSLGSPEAPKTVSASVQAPTGDFAESQVDARTAATPSR